MIKIYSNNDQESKYRCGRDSDPLFKLDELLLNGLRIIFLSESVKDNKTENVFGSHPSHKAKIELKRIKTTLKS